MTLISPGKDLHINPFTNIPVRSQITGNIRGVQNREEFITATSNTKSNQLMVKAKLGVVYGIHGSGEWAGFGCDNVTPN